MKHFIQLVLCLATIVSLAQKKDKSSNFDLPEGNTTVLQLKSGNTFFMDITKKDGIKVLLFDTLRKKCASAVLDSKILGEKIGYYLLEGVFEIKGDVVIFLTVAEDRTPILVRLIADGKTGKLKSEEKVATLDKMKAGAGYSMVFGDVEIPDFEVIKDPESEYYAIVRYNTMAAETKDRIEVLHCGPDHKVINKANYTTPGDHFKYTNYLSGYVRKDEFVVIGTYAFNTDKTGGDEGRFFVSQLAKGKSGFKQTELPYKTFYKNANCFFDYNISKQLLHMSIVSDVNVKGNKHAYEFHFQNINPSSLKVDKEYSPDFSKVNDYYTGKMERKDDFAGILKKTAFNSNGDLVMYFQQETIESGKYGTKIFLGDVAMLTVSPAGKTIGSAVFPALVYYEDNCANTMRMVAGANNAYVLFNNTVDNMSLDDNKKADMVREAAQGVPVKYTYNSTGVRKEYLFKQPKEKKGNPYCDFSAADYNPATKKFVTMQIDPEKDKACLIWVGLD